MELNGRDRMRIHIADTAGVLIAYAQNLRNYCDIRDDLGVQLSVRSLALHLKAIIKTSNELWEDVKAGAAAAEPRDG